MPNANWWRTDPADDGSVLIPAYIVNLDLAHSSTLEIPFDPITLKTEVNEIQDGIEDMLRAAGFVVQGWSGDGLIALFDGQTAKSDLCIKHVVGILEFFQAKKRARITAGDGHGGLSGWELIDLRIAVVFGEIPWDEMLGRVIARPMNVAGHFQKNCPEASILIDDTVFTRLSTKSEYRRRFEQDTTVMHGGRALPAFSLQAEDSSAPLPFPQYEAEILGEFFADGYEYVVRAPAVCYLVGDFDSIFGYPALIQPLPLFSYVGIATGENGLRVDGVRVADENVDCYDRRSGLKLPKPDVSVPIEDDERSLIWSTIQDALTREAPRGLRLKNLSMIPTRCGLAASSAFGAAVALATLLLSDAEAVTSLLGQMKRPKEAPIDTRDPCFVRAYKLAWAIENIFEGGASSGGGVFASIVGSPDGFPLIYIGEKRGFDGGFPFHFANGGATSSFADEEFGRIRATGFRSKFVCKRDNVGLDFALLFTSSRETKKTGDLVADFFNRSGDIGKYGVIEALARQHGAARGLRREMITRLARRTFSDKHLGHTLPAKRFLNPQPSGTRDLFIEWTAQALGFVSFAAQQAFLSFEEGRPTRAMRTFLRQLDAYQELRSALGLSGSLADLYNSRADFLAMEIPGNAPYSGVGSSDAPYSFGSKLVGSGGGGDFLVMAPAGFLRKHFPMLRRKLAVESCMPVCHYVSWHTSEMQIPAATVAAWRYTDEGYVSL